ncbi:DUF6338 family protein [Amycolatopsis sp. NPDC051071]|uniref:DUF6338 family protein n=1 Tax=Amycolatopsis sp. NPDC051071 TaxID=3154637 RepID=UPI0034243906
MTAAHRRTRATSIPKSRNRRPVPETPPDPTAPCCAGGVPDPGIVFELLRERRRAGRTESAFREAARMALGSLAFSLVSSLLLTGAHTAFGWFISLDRLTADPAAYARESLPLILTSVVTELLVACLLAVVLDGGGMVYIGTDAEPKVIGEKWPRVVLPRSQIRSIWLQYRDQETAERVLPTARNRSLQTKTSPVTTTSAGLSD